MKENTPLILAASRNPGNLKLLCKVLEESDFRCLPVRTLSELDAVIDKTEQVALALLELAGFDHRIWKRCLALRESSVLFFVIITAATHQQLEASSLKFGARAVLKKPFAPDHLLGLVQQFAAAPRD